MNETILQFRVSVNNPREAFARFRPGGAIVLNRTAWRGKEPRSCGVTKVTSHPYSATHEGPFVFDIEVSYRPKGCVTYAGNTRYDGWSATKVDQMKDGTLLDGKGQPLPEGQPIVYLPFKTFNDIEFNDVDFGNFVGEFEKPSVQRISVDDAMQQLESGSQFKASITSDFVAPHRSRPLTKIIISSRESGTGYDCWGSKIINICNSTPHLEQVLLGKLTELMCEYMEGKVSIKSLSNGESEFVELSDSLVECTPNEYGLDSWFNVLSTYVPLDFMEELAKRLIAQYRVHVTVVEGKKSGLLLRRE